MPDISMCSRNDCPLKRACYRNPASGTKPDSYQSYSSFGGQRPEECEDFMQTYDRTKK